MIRKRVSERTFRERLEQGDSYGLLLALIIATYVLMAVVSFSDWTRVFIGLLFGGMLVLTLHTSHVRGRWMQAAFVLVAFSTTINVVQAATGNTTLRGASFIMIVPILAAPVVILYRILRHPVVGIETLLGAFSAYLLIGIGFAAAYIEMDIISPHFFVQPGPHNVVSYLYFSFVVMTTLGFGDLSPAKDLGRVVVSLEALLGQIFLVTLVARLVSQYAGRSPVAEAPAEAVDESET